MDSEEKIPIIVVKDLAARFGKNVVFEGVNFQVYKGEILVIVGASGCGKSTLLRIMIGLQKPYSGQVLYQGTDITHCRAKKNLTSIGKISVFFFNPALCSVR